MKHRMTLLLLVALILLAAALMLGVNSSYKVAGWTWDSQSADVAAAAAPSAHPVGWKWGINPNKK